MGFRRTVLFIGAILVALLLPVVASAAGPSVLTVRTDGGHDALWLVSPAGGSPAAAGTLPGVAASAAVSPDGANVAYLPDDGTPFVWIGYGTLAPKTISLKSAGLKSVGSMTWIAADRLLVSGAIKGGYAHLRTARLFVVDVRTGAVEPFRGLRGVEPSADVSSGKVVYVQITKLDDGSARNDHTPLYRESLRLLSLDGSGAGRLITAVQYRLYTDHRAFSEPQLAPGGRWLLVGETGSDVSVTYKLCDTEFAMPWLTAYSGGYQAAAWEPGGSRVAFGVLAHLGGVGDSFEPYVFVDDVATGALTRSPAGVVSGTASSIITHVAWSSDGMLIVDALDSDAGRQNEHMLVMRGDDLSTVTNLGRGRLSVWVP